MTKVIDNGDLAPRALTARVTTIIVEGDRNLRLDRASDVIGDVGGNVRTEYRDSESMSSSFYFLACRHWKS